MSLLKKLLEAVRRTPQTPEEIAAEAEARQLPSRWRRFRLSQRAGSAGENYQSGRAE